MVEAGPYVITVARVAGADLGAGETLTVGPATASLSSRAAVREA